VGGGSFAEYKWGCEVLKIYRNRLAKSCLRCNALHLFPATTKNLRFSVFVTICEIALFAFSCLFIDSCVRAMAQASNFRPYIAEARLRFRFGHRSQLITDKEHRHISHVSGVALFAVSPSVSGADSCRNLIRGKRTLQYCSLSGLLIYCLRCSAVLVCHCQQKLKAPLGCVGVSLSAETEGTAGMCWCVTVSRNRRRRWALLVCHCHQKLKAPLGCVGVSLSTETEGTAGLCWCVTVNRN
jgi:hypothetical protein